MGSKVWTRKEETSYVGIELFCRRHGYGYHHCCTAQKGAQRGRVFPWKDGGSVMLEPLSSARFHQDAELGELRHELGEILARLCVHMW